MPEDIRHEKTLVFGPLTIEISYVSWDCGDGCCSDGWYIGTITEMYPWGTVARGEIESDCEGYHDADDAVFRLLEIWKEDA